jgi:hypothetical protein
MNLLKVDHTTFKVSVEPEALKIKAIKDLVKGSSQEQAEKKLAFVYLVEHPLSPFMDIAPDKRVEEIKNALNLKLSPLDNDIVEARAFFRSLVETTDSKTVSSIRDGLFATAKLIDRTSELVDVILQEINPSEFKDKSKRAEAVKELKNANDLLDSVLDKSAKVPKTIDTLDSLQEKLKKKMSLKRNVRGKGDINYFEE